MSDWPSPLVIALRYSRGFVGHARRRIPQLHDVLREWCDNHPDDAVPDGLVATPSWPSTGA